MVFVSCQFYLALFTVNSGSFFVFRLSCLFLNFSENLGIFRVALLFICQRSVFLLLLLFSAATLISYHDRFRLSTTFLKTFLSWKTFVFRGRFLYYHICQTSVNNFSEIFLNFFSVVVLSRYCPDNESEYITPYITCQHYFLNFLHKLSPAMQIPHVQGIFTTFLFYFTRKGSFCPSCSIRYARELFSYRHVRILLSLV